MLFQWFVIFVADVVTHSHYQSSIDYSQGPWSYEQIRDIVFTANQLYSYDKYYRKHEYTTKPPLKNLTNYLLHLAQEYGYYFKWVTPVLDTNRYPKISYESFLEKAKTGDLLLFEQEDPESILIRAITRSPFAHSAMFIRNSTLFDKPFLLQSTNEYSPGLGTENVNGQDYYTMDYLSLYPAKVLWVDIDSKNFHRYRWAKYQLFDKFGGIRGKRYIDEKYFIPNLIAKTLGLSKVGDQERRHCSELIAYLFVQMGHLNFKIDPFSFGPVDFSDLIDHQPKIFTESFNIGMEYMEIVDIPFIKKNPNPRTGYEKVKLLLKAGLKPVGILSHLFEPHLCSACVEGDHTTVRLLLNHGINPYFKCGASSPILLAHENGHFTIEKLLKFT